jgi:outer membrane receptor protein involved in Fe transport
MAIASAAVAQPAPPSRAPKLAPITVTGRALTDTSQLDRKSYAIGRDIQGASGSIADVLRNIPSVDVDLSGNVTLRGQSNVTILVDGKPTSLFRGAAGGQVLQQLPAGQYERVEVMTNPSAAFGAEGTGGIINLITRRNRAPGVSGSVRANLGTSGRRGVGGSVSGKTGKLTLGTDGSWRHDPQFSRDVIRDTEFDSAGRPTLNTERIRRGVGDLHLWTLRGSADYDLDAKSRLSAEIHHTTFLYHSHMTEELTGTDSSGLPAVSFNRDGTLTMDRGDTEGSLTFHHDYAGTGHNLVTSLTVEHSRDTSGRVFEDQSQLPPIPAQFDNVHSLNDQHRTEIKGDYNDPLHSGAHLAAGYDVERDSDLFDDHGGFGPDAVAAAMPQPVFSERFHVRRTIAAAYATYEREFDFATVQLGLRAEAADTRTKSDATGFSNSANDFDLFPSVHAEHSLGKTDLLRASYARRISRPDPASLDPFRRFIDPLHFEAGNPDLKAQTTNSFELGFEHHQGSTLDSATLFYRHSSAGTTDVTSEIGDRILLTTQENLRGSDSAGAEIVVNGNVTKKLAYRLSGNLLHSRIDASNLGLGERSGWIVSGKASADWQPDAADLAQLTFSLTGNKLLPQGSRAAMLLVNAGFRHKLNARLWAFVTVQDALHSYQQHDRVELATLIERSTASARTRAAFLGLTYDFGKKGRDPSFDYSG